MILKVPQSLDTVAKIKNPISAVNSLKVSVLDIYILVETLEENNSIGILMFTYYLFWSLNKDQENESTLIDQENESTLISQAVAKSS